jgi:hypothetical protein
VLILSEGVDQNQAMSSVNQEYVIGVAGDIREFYAFAVTYLQTYKPFSAFFRVVRTELIADILDEKLVANTTALPPWCVGPIIAEARGQIGGIESVADLSIQGCLATASMPIALGITRGLSFRHVEALFENWLSTRQRLTDDVLRIVPATIWGFWQLVSSSFSPSATQIMDRSLASVASFLVEAASDDESYPANAWVAVTQELPKARLALDRMTGAREDRVRAFDNALAELVGQDQVDLRRRECVAGYLASRVAGGSLRYFALLQAVEDRLPAAQMWFGLFCGIHKDTDVMNIGDCLGRRLSRKETIGRGLLFDQPNADISIDELQLFMTDPRAEIRLRTEQSAVIRIEIFPGVAAAFRKPREWRRLELDTRTSGAQFEALSELKVLVDRMNRTILRIVEPEQRDLFDKNKKQSGVGRRIRKESN